MAQQWAHDTCNHQEGDKPLVLSKEYQQHAMVFDEKASTCFPPEREAELSIDLLHGAPKGINCKVYPLLRTEQDQLCQFLTEEEAKGYIYKGSSPYTAPIFLIGKKDLDEC